MRKITINSIEEFKKHLIDGEKSESTIKKYIHDILSLKKWVNESDLCKDVVLVYKNFLIENYAPASVNSMLSSINSFFEYYEWYELRVRSLKIQKKIFADKEKELSKEEYEKLLRVAKKRNNERLNLLMQTICSTGIRVSELKSITVSAVKRKQATINCKGKMRIVFLPEALCKMLVRYIKKKKIMSGAVFVTKNGRPIDRSSVWRMMKKLCKEAQVSAQKVFPHNLRHLFARTYYSIEKDIVRLADLLGHSSINTTRIYTMEDGEIHRRQIQKLGLLKC